MQMPFWRIYCVYFRPEEVASKVMPIMAVGVAGLDVTAKVSDSILLLLHSL